MAIVIAQSTSGTNTPRCFFCLGLQVIVLRRDSLGCRTQEFKEKNLRVVYDTLA